LYRKVIGIRKEWKTMVLKPCYGIYADPFDYKGYVHLQIPKGEDFFYPFIDSNYELWGIEKIGIHE
jgi:hypothetical protein